MAAGQCARLFALTFLLGPPALAEGLSLDGMIENSASRAGTERRVQSVGALVAGATMVVGGRALLSDTPGTDQSARAASYLLLGAGAITLAAAPFAYFGSDPVERLANEARAIPGAPSDPARLERLDVLLALSAKEEAGAREAGAWTSGFVAALFLGLAVAESLSETTSPTSRIIRTAGYGAGASSAAVRSLLLATTPGPVGILASNWSIARGTPAVANALPDAPSRIFAMAVAPSVTRTSLGISFAGEF